MAKILVVEDEAMVLILAESILQDAGYETLTAGSLPQAQAVIQSDQQIDLIFTDVNLVKEPEGGLKVGQLLPSKPVLYTSAQTMTDGMKQMFVERSEFLPKPYTNHELLDAVSRLLK